MFGLEYVHMGFDKKVNIFENNIFSHVYMVSSKHSGIGLGEIFKVMQTLYYVSGLHVAVLTSPNLS